MGILKRDGNENRARRNEQNALVRSEQPQLSRDAFQLAQRDPFQLMREMLIDPFRMFQQMAPWIDFAREGRDLMWSPGFEVRETDNAVVFKGDMPGVREEDLDISLVGNNLQITGKRERDEEQEQGTVYTYERSYGQFSRTFELPDAADLDNIRTDLKSGVLTIVVPKKAGTAPHRRKIQIGSGSKS